jgi:folate-dependent phosphoribosylglycinamide formyltransferase PurN
MKLLMVTSSGANQRALANKLHAAVSLSEIAVVDIPPAKKRPAFSTRLASVTVGFPLRRAWSAMSQHYESLFRHFPDVPISKHKGVNATTMLQLIERMRPDFVLVSGTDLLRENLITAIGLHGRVMNLHTGISPHIKGGPNCTNWALALREFSLIGNTIMWLDAGIDSGNIIATEQTPLTGTESLVELHLKVMDHSHNLYCRCVQMARGGHKLPSVPQESLGSGRLFLTRDWTAKRIVLAMYNFYGYYSSKNLSVNKG